MQLSYVLSHGEDKRNDRVTCVHSAPGRNVDRDISVKGMEEVPAITVAFADVPFPRCHAMSCTDC